MTPARKPLPRLARDRKEQAGILRLLRWIRRSVQAEEQAMGLRPRLRLVWSRPAD